MMKCVSCCLTVAVIWAFIFGSPAQAITLWGRIVDENNQPVTGTTDITVAKRDGTRIETRTEADGSYKIDVPSSSVEFGDVIDSVRFRRADRHPTIITQAAGQLILPPVIPPAPGATAVKTLSGGTIREDYANKVMFPRVGPKGYERNMAQLQVYEYLYYAEMAEGSNRDALYNRYAWLLSGMPRVDDKDKLPELTDVQRKMLREKRAQVYRLYGMALPEEPKRTATVTTSCCSGRRRGRR
jgi:hypothetical protein